MPGERATLCFTGSYRGAVRCCRRRRAGCTRRRQQSPPPREGVRRVRQPSGQMRDRTARRRQQPPLPPGRESHARCCRCCLAPERRWLTPLRERPHPRCSRAARTARHRRAAEHSAQHAVCGRPAFGCFARCGLRRGRSAPSATSSSAALPRLAQPWLAASTLPSGLMSSPSPARRRER